MDLHGDSSCHSNNPPPKRKSTAIVKNKHLPPTGSSEVAPSGSKFVEMNQQKVTGGHDGDGYCESAGYTTETLPGATSSLQQTYGVDFNKEQPISEEERRNNAKPVLKEDAKYYVQTVQKIQLPVPGEFPLQSQKSTKPLDKSGTESNVNNPPRFPRKACVLYKNEQYGLDPKLLSLPRETKYLVKVRTEICPGRYVAKLELHCAR